MMWIRNLSGANPGFPVGGGANPPGVVPTYDFAKFSEKLHEIEKILVQWEGGAHARGAPLRSATAFLAKLFCTNFAHVMGVTLCH